MPKQVAEDEFFEKIGPLDVILEVKEPYPYKILFKLRHSGKIVGYENRDRKYYINEGESYDE